MSETKPRWIVKPDPSWDGEWIVLVREGDDYRSVAVSFGFECDATLAAAAPEMQTALEAIEALEVTEDQFVSQGPALTLKRLRAAVAFARTALAHARPPQAPVAPDSATSSRDRGEKK